MLLVTSKLSLFTVNSMTMYTMTKRGCLGVLEQNTQPHMRFSYVGEKEETEEVTGSPGDIYWAGLLQSRKMEITRKKRSVSRRHIPV